MAPEQIIIQAMCIVGAMGLTALLLFIEEEEDTRFDP